MSKLFVKEIRISTLVISCINTIRINKNIKIYKNISVIKYFCLTCSTFSYLLFLQI